MFLLIAYTFSDTMGGRVCQCQNQKFQVPRQGFAHQPGTIHRGLCANCMCSGKQIFPSPEFCF